MLFIQYGNNTTAGACTRRAQAFAKVEL